MGCEGEGNGREEEWKVGRVKKGVVRYHPKKSFYLEKMLLTLMLGKIEGRRRKG